MVKGLSLGVERQLARSRTDASIEIHGLSVKGSNVKNFEIEMRC